MRAAALTQTGEKVLRNDPHRPWPSHGNISYHVRERKGCQLVFHGFLHFCQFSIQRVVDIPSHGASEIEMLMEVEETFFFQIFRSLINIKEGNILWFSGKKGAAGAAVHCNHAGPLQAGKEAADDDRIHFDAAGQHVAGNLFLMLVKGYIGKHMNGNSKLTGNLHGTSFISMHLILLS